MEQRLSFVTLAVEDLERVRAFYLAGLGWEAALDDGDEVVMLTVADRVILSLWQREAFEQEAGPIGQGPAPITLAHNCRDRAEVDEVLAAARAAGATDVREAQDRAWGGYSGYFADPDGYRWEVAWNPGPLGQQVLPEVRR